MIVEEYKKENNRITSAKGIENSAISLNNPLFTDIIKSIEKENDLKAIEENTVVNPEEIEYGGTVYVDEAYDESSVYIEYEPQYIEQVANNNSNMSCVGSYDITAYTWTGNTMANGEWPYEGCIASCDFPLGTTLYIENIGTYIVKDVCPTGGVIDIYMDSYDACINFGRQYANVYIIN